jgi:hypothetical protein
VQSVVFRLIVSCAVLVATGIPIQGAILFSDNFDNVASGANIDARVPAQTSFNGAAWVAITSNFLGDNAGGLSAASAANNFASLDLGANYLVENPGVYQVALDITQPTVGSPGASWIALGFAPSNTTAANFVANNGAPWLLYRIKGNAVFFGGPNVSNTQAVGVVATGTAHSFKLELDTTVPLWTVNAYVDNSQVDLNGASAGMTFTYTTNPTASRYVAMSTGISGTGGTGKVDNFMASGPVPEPTASVLIAAGLGVLGIRRRRGSLA